MTAHQYSPTGPLGVERLEARDTPAGNVFAFVSAGQLSVYGDAADNQFVVQQTPQGNVFVYGQNGTLVNGQYGGVYVGYGVLGGVQLVGGGGADQMVVTGVYTNGPITAVGGEQNDRIELYSVSAGSLTVMAAGGDDVIVTNGVQVCGSLDVSGGAGFDVFRNGGLWVYGGFAFRDIERFE